MSRRLSIVVYILTFALLALFLIYPILNTVKAAFFTADGSRFTFEYFFEIFRNRNYLEGLGNAMRMAIFSTFGCLLISLPLAYASTRFEFPGKALLSSLILIPLILPPFVGAIGVKKILGKQGSLNSLLDNLGIINSPIDWLGAGQLTGVVIMIVLHLYPILYLNISAALSNLDPALEEAAENLGCSPWKRFWTITLPLTLPGIFAGSTIVFIWSFTELGVPLIFDYNRVTPVQIFDGIKDLSGNPMPYALVVVVLLSTLLLFAVRPEWQATVKLSNHGKRQELPWLFVPSPSWQSFLILE